MDELTFACILSSGRVGLRRQPVHPQDMQQAIDLQAELLCGFQARLTYLNYSPNTVRAYLGAARRFLRYFQGVPPEAYTVEHVELYLASRKRKPQSVCQEIEYLRAYFKHLVRQGVLRENPCARIERPRWVFQPQPAPSRQEYECLVAACQTQEELRLVSLVYWTGLRLSEFRLLRWDQLDLSQRRIVVKGKGGHQRMVCFPAHAAAFLSPNGSPWVFPSRGSGPRSEAWVRQALAALGRRAGLPYRLCPHLLRHGWVRAMKVAGLPIEVTARLAGHADIRTTARVYGRMDEDDLQRAYDSHLTAAAGYANVGGDGKR